MIALAVCLHNGQSIICTAGRVFGRLKHFIRIRNSIMRSVTANRSVMYISTRPPSCWSMNHGLNGLTMLVGTASPSHRYYRNGLKLLNQAVQDWQQNDISFVLQMGDILDGSQPRDASLEVLASVSFIAGRHLWVLSPRCKNAMHALSCTTCRSTHPRLFLRRPIQPCVVMRTPLGRIVCNTCIQYQCRRPACLLWFPCLRHSQFPNKQVQEMPQPRRFVGMA